jgi:hypothetical protein
VARAADATHAGEPLGRLGDFQLLREVGRGGMGVVYEAEQISLRRRVALKVLPFAAAADPRQLQRFRTEALAAAHLQHEHIVPVYAVGTERGVHYYAMRFIDGQSLAAVIDARRGADAPRHADHPVRSNPTVGPARRHYFRWVADLCRQAALALEHAHQAGIVHRDVKPANLLLDSAGKLWVADFGLARVATDNGLTQTGEILGTLRYASPEQATGKPGLIDHRSDVYSLGVTLYELLTRQLMFAAVNRMALLRQIADLEPIPPRQMDRAIPAELETIVLKAVAKDPLDRYATAAAFADDLQRFLDDRPILARRPTLPERAMKWLRRHPGYTAAGVLGLTLAAVGFAAATALVAREKNRTDDALVREQQRANEAEQRFDLARHAADDMIRLAGEMGYGPQQQATRRQLLETALAYYQQFIELRKDDPKAQAELTTTRERVSGILADLAVMQGGVRHLMLARPDVQDDLRLTDEQRVEVRDALRGERIEPGYARQSAEQRSQTVLEQIKRREAEVAKLLTPDQLKRLGQITLQEQGLMAFQDADVVAQLKLTADQKEKLRAFEGPFGFRPGPPDFLVPQGGFGGRGPGGRGEGGRGGEGGPGGFPGFPGGMGGKGRGFGPDGVDKALAILTDEQKATWKNLTGPEFRPRKK